MKRNEAIRVDASLGGYTLVFHRNIYHQIGSLLPTCKNENKFLQILFYDTEMEELNRRMEVAGIYKSTVDENLMKMIQRELHKTNNLYQQFKSIGSQVLKEPGHQMVIVDDFRKLRIKKQKIEAKRYEKPAAKDIGLIIPLKQLNQNEKKSRDIIVQRDDKTLKRISEFNPAVDAFAYPLLYPNGDLGWSPDMVYEVTPKRGHSALEEQVDDEQNLANNQINGIQEIEKVIQRGFKTN